jgi:hypothetical protein
VTPAHKIINAHLYRVDEVLAVYQSPSMPTLAVEAEGRQPAPVVEGRYSLAEYHERLKVSYRCPIAALRW